MTAQTSATAAAPRSRMTPELIIAAGCLTAIITFGPRAAIGQFQLPVLGDFPITSAGFSTAMALQYLFWGLGQPFAGAMADKYGTGRVLAIGAVVYSFALALMLVSRDNATFMLTQGVLFGLALSACSFNLIIGAFQKMLPPEKRSFAFGVGTASGSFGQFLFTPLAGGMIEAIGWQNTALIFSGVILTAIPLALMLSGKPAEGKNDFAADLPGQTFGQALSEACTNKSYICLVLGFSPAAFNWPLSPSTFSVTWWNPACRRARVIGPSRWWAFSISSARWALAGSPRAFPSDGFCRSSMARARW